MAGPTKIQRTIESDAFSKFKQIIEKVAPEYDFQIINLVEHLISNNSGNAEQLSCWILKELNLPTKPEK